MAIDCPNFGKLFENLFIALTSASVIKINDES